MPYYSVTLEWDDRYVVAPVKADNVEAAITAAYEWANDGGYDHQDTYDDCGPTYVGHVGEHPSMKEAARAGTHEGECLEIPFEHRGDEAKLRAVRAALQRMVEAARDVSDLTKPLIPAIHALSRAAADAEQYLDKPQKQAS